MYIPSRHFADFHLAGFAYWDGVEVFNDLKVGSRLELRPESDNPYDPEAVAIFYENKKLGYIPRASNAQISQLLHFDNNIFEAFICQIDLDKHPERQIRVVVKLIDAARA